MAAWTNSPMTLGNASSAYYARYYEILSAYSAECSLGLLRKHWHSHKKSTNRGAMAYDYNKLYGETPNALGEPTTIFVKFFKELEPKNLRVLDVGCGQGRDALFIARLGHRVVGVDMSTNGIRDLLAVANTENLTIEGAVADITTYQPDGLFDVILIDRTLHMLPEGPRHSTLHNFLGHVAKDGWVLIADETTNIRGFQKVISDHELNWKQEHATRGHLFIRRV